MSIQQSLYLKFDLELFDIEELSEAQHLATQSNGALYCWKTTCSSNWLERGISKIDVLGIVVLPKGLPHYIEMPNDEDEVG